MSAQIDFDQRREPPQVETVGIANEERDHVVGVGLFFEDPDGRQLEAITYRGVE